MAENAWTNVSIVESIYQMCKQQDQTYSGSFIDDDTGERGVWAMVTDGHGTDTCINYLRSITQDMLNKIVGSTMPVENLANEFNNKSSISYYESTGATMCLVKIYTDRIVFINSGDSQAAMYKNGVLEFITEQHNSFNPKERARLEAKYPGFEYRAANNIEVFDNDKLCGITGQYALFNGINLLATTQALGHHNMTGFAPDITTFVFEPEDKIQIIICSDGFWDMVNKNNPQEILSFANKTAEELSQFAVARWRQTWNMYNTKEDEEPSYVGTFTESNYDDVCAVKIDINP